MQWDDKKISRLYQIGKRADEKFVPPFEAVLARSRTGSRVRRIPALGYLGVVTVILVMSAIVFLRTRSHPAGSLAGLQMTPSLQEWRSPTDFLLQTPGHELRDSLPQIGWPSAFMANNNQALSRSQGER
jgi:hypothetical protein